MKNMKIAQKLVVSFLIISLITAIVGASGIISMTLMKDSGTKLYEKQTVPLPIISSIILDVDRLGGQAQKYVLFAGSAQNLAQTQAETEKYQAEYEKNVKAYEPTISTAETKKIYGDAGQMYTSEMIPKLEEIISLAKSGNTQKAALNSKITAPLRRRFWAITRSA